MSVEEVVAVDEGFHLSGPVEVVDWGSYKDTIGLPESLQYPRGIILLDRQQEALDAYSKAIEMDPVSHARRDELTYAIGRYRRLRRHIGSPKKRSSARMLLLDNGAEPLIAAGQGTVAMLNCSQTARSGGM